MRVVDVRDFDIPSDENDYDELVAFADTMASIEQFDAYTKDEVIAMLTELKTEIDIMSDSVVEGRTVTITSWRGMQKRICKLIQFKINKLKENTNGDK